MAVLETFFHRPGYFFRSYSSYEHVDGVASGRVIARALLRALEDRELVREVTGRRSFRLYSAASLDLVAVKM